MEAMRCLKRRISDVVYRQLVADAKTVSEPTNEASPGGHCGATQESSAVDLPPLIDTSDQPLPDPHNRRYNWPAVPEESQNGDSSTDSLTQGGAEMTQVARRSHARQLIRSASETMIPSGPRT
jgi:hypothetical protein